eukprot:scaffold49788_cov18-Prasinocladus_malaysianus.AAC.3
MNAKSKNLGRYNPSQELVENILNSEGQEGGANHEGERKGVEAALSGVVYLVHLGMAKVHHRRVSHLWGDRTGESACKLPKEMPSSKIF